MFVRLLVRRDIAIGSQRRLRLRYRLEHLHREGAGRTAPRLLRTCSSGLAGLVRRLHRRGADSVECAGNAAVTACYCFASLRATSQKQ